MILRFFLPIKKLHHLIVLLFKRVIYSAKRTYYLEQTYPSDQNEQFYLKGICHVFAFTFHAIGADTRS